MTDAAHADRLPTVAMLGGGNMNGAILAGLLESPARPESPVRVTTRTAESAARYAEDDRVQALAAEDDPEANRAAVADAGVVVLGVKPYAVAGLLDEVRDALADGVVIVSVAAGVPIELIEARAPEGARVVRAMPNTPATIGLGATGIAAGPSADDEALALARRLFECVGEVVEVAEEQIAVVAAASGSGPAYVYLLAQRMMEAAVELGLDADGARTLVVGTLRGAAEMLHRDPGTSAAELRRRVTSPNGTTERAIQVFEEEDLGGTVRRAMEANVARSLEMAEEQAARTGQGEDGGRAE